MNLSVCIITKNEKENLRKCLQRLKGYGFELVVVDTGSVDGTVSMVSEYTESIYEFPWCDDFAKAKNFAVSKAANDLVFVLDSDEFIERIDVPKLENLIMEYPGYVGRILRKNFICHQQEQLEAKEYINRIFDRRQYHYEGKIHEQLVANDNGPCRTYKAPVEVEHCGYLLTEEEKKKKSKRNICLLEEVLKEQGDDPYLLYQLGKAFYMMGEYESAREHFSRALYFELEPELEYVIDMVHCYGYVLLKCGRAQEALGYVGLEEAFGNNSDFQFLMGFIYMNNEMYPEAVDAFQKAVALHRSSVTGMDSYLANYNIGVIYECLSQMGRAVDYYWKCGSYIPAVRRLGNYYEKKNPIQAYLYYRQQAFLCRNSERQRMDGLAEKIRKKYHVQVPKTAIVILSYNTKEETEACIESIRANCIPGTYELIVVDNASTDESVDWLRQQNDIKLLCNRENQGYPVGCNQGIGLAEADSDIWLLNSDTLIPENALFWLQMGLYELENTGACGSMSNYCSNYQNIDEMTVDSDNYLEYLKRHMVSVSNPYEKKTWLVGFSVLVKRRALSEIGLLDERFSPGNSEDTDLGYRLAMSGWQQLLCKNSFVFHYGSRSFGKRREKYIDLIHVNEQKFIQKWQIHSSKYSYIKVWDVQSIKRDAEDCFSVLDIGCGTGATLARVQYLYPHATVLGIEKQPVAARLAQMVTDVICADASEVEEEKIAEGAMDYIFTEGIWEHVSNPSQLFCKIRKWLRPDGVLTGCIYNADHPFRTEVPEKLLKFGIGISDSEHLVYYTIEEWLKLLEQNQIAVDELSFTREPHTREMETPYQYFWKGHFISG